MRREGHGSGPSADLAGSGRVTGQTCHCCIFSLFFIEVKPLLLQQVWFRHPYNRSSWSVWTRLHVAQLSRWQPVTVGHAANDSVCRHCIKALSLRVWGWGSLTCVSAHQTTASRQQKCHLVYDVYLKLCRGRTSTIKAHATCCIYNRRASTSTSSTSASTSEWTSRFISITCRCYI